jgi:hypothetical protein
MWIVESIRQREHYELISTSLTDVSTEMPLDMISCVMQNLGIAMPQKCAGATIVTADNEGVR